MRLLGMTVLLIIIQLACGIFYQTLDTTEYSLNPYTSGTNEFRLWTFIMNPVIWTNSGFWVLISAIITVGAGIAIGTIFGAKSDLTYLFTLFLFFSSFGAIPIANLYLAITSDVTVFGCIVGQPCQFASIVAFFFSGILAAAWIYTCIEWWSGRPAT